MASPFIPQMVKMQTPADSGSHVAAAGFLLEVENGCVDVPKHLVDEMKSHGLTEWKPSVAAKK